MVQTIVDFEPLDLSRDVISEEELRSVLPHAHEFRMIDGICHLDLEASIAVGYKDWESDPWWARGHIPGHPLMPGVLMIEGGAQIATFLVKKSMDWAADKFMGLAGVNGVRIRGQVVPPARVYFVAGAGTSSGHRLTKNPAQAIVDGKLVMEMELMGIAL